MEPCIILDGDLLLVIHFCRVILSRMVEPAVVVSVLRPFSGIFWSSMNASCVSPHTTLLQII